MEIFKEFYLTKTKHRKLTWIYSLGTCNLIGKFDQKPVELIVTAYQVFHCDFTLILYRPCFFPHFPSSFHAGDA